MARVQVGGMIDDKYEVVGVLGEGGTGIVYDAVRRDGTPVALKVMHEALAGDEQIRGRFQREVAILRRLDGDHVCPVLDFGEVSSSGGPDGEPGDASDRTLLYIALAKIAGRPLSEIIAEGPLPVERALDVMLEVLAALETAHAQGIIHRDLKPANVLIEKGEKAVVVDFGMSKIITGAGVGPANLTTHNMVFGTPEYMSPEQARGDELDARCDVYAAGVMLYELLAGSQPFTGATPLNVLTAHLTSDLEPPSKRPGAVGRVTAPLEAVVLRALARDREKRWPSARAFADALRRARGADSAAFAKTVPQSQLADAERASLVDPIAPTLIGASAPPAPRSTKPPSVRAEPPRPSTRPPEPEGGIRMWVVLWVLVGLASIGTGIYFALRS